MAAAAIGDPLASPQRLASAGQTVQDVRTLLSHGRGNVDADTAPSRGHNGIGSSVAQSGSDPLNQMANAVNMGAAVCNQHAQLAAVIHAPHMNTQDRVVANRGPVELGVLHNDGSVSPSEEFHDWAEWQRPPGRDAASTVVMDAWANGPAVRLKDSAWADALADPVMSLDRDGASEVKTRLENLVPLVHPDHDAYVASRLDGKRSAPTQWDRFAEAQVVSGDFAQQARDALAKMSREEQCGLVADAAIKAYGLSESSASSPRAAHAVLREARHLDEQGRPPIKPPRF